MIYEKLLAAGAVVVTPATVWCDRAKVNGHMWGGSAVLELNGDRYDMGLWHHGGYEETVDSLLPRFTIRGIVSDKLGYDLHWHAVVTPCGILYHPTGWFHDRELARLVGDYNNNFPERITDAHIQRLLDVGLKWLLTW